MGNITENFGSVNQNGDFSLCNRFWESYPERERERKREREREDEEEEEENAVMRS